MDIWRVRNPESKKFTRRKKKPLIQRRLNYWLGEISYCEDLRIQWDYIKYKIRQETIRYSKGKSNVREIKLKKSKKD